MLWVGVPHASKKRRELFARVGLRRTRFDPSDDVEPVPVGALRLRARRHEWQPHLREAAQRELEVLRENADDFVRLAVQHQASPENRRVQPEAAAPGAVAQHDDAGRARRHVGGHERPAERGHDAQRFDEIGKEGASRRGGHHVEDFRVADTVTTYRVDIGDAVEWQRRERASWTRPWDDDYEEVKAEFPDLFDAEDDRQRQIYLDMKAGRYPDPKKPST